MLSLFLISVLVVPVLWIVLHQWLIPRCAPAARPWARSASIAGFAMGVVYVRGLVGLFAWDIEETCELTHHTGYDPEVAFEVGLFPPSRLCNAGYDLVPGWVSWALLGLAAVAVGCAAVAVIRFRPRV